ncbi:unnamed protein product, partial [Porites evermanni]
MAACKFYIVIINIVALLFGAKSLNNGLARTPPMGWMAWVKFRCSISEDLVKTMADHIVSAGYKDVGYEYVSIDDCWMAHNRTAWGELQPNPTAFPNGMKAVADY